MENDKTSASETASNGVSRRGMPFLQSQLPGGCERRLEWVFFWALTSAFLRFRGFDQGAEA